MGKKSEKTDMWQLLKNVAIILGMFSAGIGVGLVPRCDNLQTVAQAKEDHKALKESNDKVEAKADKIEKESKERDSSIAVGFKEDLGKVEEKLDESYGQLRQDLWANRKKIEKQGETIHQTQLQILQELRSR